MLCEGRDPVPKADAVTNTYYALTKHWINTEMSAKEKKNTAELVSVLRNSCFISDHTIESGHWLQCSSLGISMCMNMCVCVCVCVHACTLLCVCPLHVQVCACPCLCVYASVGVFLCMCGRLMDQGVEGWICSSPWSSERGTGTWPYITSAAPSGDRPASEKSLDSGCKDRESAWRQTGS